MLSFHSEYFVEAFNDIKWLLQFHFEEVPQFSGPLELDVSTYLQMEEDGIYKLYTVRCDGKLVGYAGFVLYRNLHHASQVHASQDVLFIKKSHRGHGSKFIRYCEQSLKAAGVHVILQHVPVTKDWSKILTRSGYKELETTYFKEL